MRHIIIFRILILLWISLNWIANNVALQMPKKDGISPPQKMSSAPAPPPSPKTSSVADASYRLMALRFIDSKLRNGAFSAYQRTPLDQGEIEELNEAFCQQETGKNSATQGSVGLKNWGGLLPMRQSNNIEISLKNFLKIINYNQTNYDRLVAIWLEDPNLKLNPGERSLAQLIDDPDWGGMDGQLLRLMDNFGTFEKIKGIYGNLKKDDVPKFIADQLLWTIMDSKKDVRRHVTERILENYVNETFTSIHMHSTAKSYMKNLKNLESFHFKNIQQLFTVIMDFISQIKELAHVPLPKSFGIKNLVEIMNFAKSEDDKRKLGHFIAKHLYHSEPSSLTRLKGLKELLERIKEEMVFLPEQKIDTLKSEIRIKLAKMIGEKDDTEKSRLAVDAVQNEFNAKFIEPQNRPLEAEMAQIRELEIKFRNFIDNQVPKEFTQKDFYDQLIRAIESMEKSGKDYFAKAEMRAREPRKLTVTEEKDVDEAWDNFWTQNPEPKPTEREEAKQSRRVKNALEKAKFEAEEQRKKEKAARERKKRVENKQKEEEKSRKDFARMEEARKREEESKKITQEFRRKRLGRGGQGGGNVSSQKSNLKIRRPSISNDVKKEEEDIQGVSNRNPNQNADRDILKQKTADMSLVGKVDIQKGNVVLLNEDTANVPPMRAADIPLKDNGDVPLNGAVRAKKNWKEAREDRRLQEMRDEREKELAQIKKDMGKAGNFNAKKEFFEYFNRRLKN